MVFGVKKSGILCKNLSSILYSLSAVSFLTIAWDENQLLFLTAKSQGKDVVFENAAYLSLKLPSEKSGEFRAVTAESLQKVIPESVGESVVRFVQEHKLAKADTVFVVGRSEVEVRPLSFPPIPNEELPDAIRFQASKEFNRYDPNSPLDFFILNEKAGNGDLPSITFNVNAKTGKTGKTDHAGGSKRRVLASIVRPDLLKEISALCEKANLNLKRVVLHPCEEAFLLRQTPTFSAEKTYLLVEVDPTEVLLTIIFRGQPVFMRSPRLFGDRAERTKISGLTSQILSEIKRTLIAVQNEIQGIAVDQIIMLGNSDEHQKLASDLSTALTLPVMQFDPWEGLKRGGKLTKSLPDSPELFAPLIGATLLAGRNLPSDIDYLNPKRRPADNSKQQIFTVIALAIGLLLMLTVGFGFWQQYAATKEVKRLMILKDQLKKESEEVDRQQKLLNSISAWESSRFDWLSQLHWLGMKVPPSENFMLTSLNITVPTSGKGRMAIKGLTSNTDIVAYAYDQMIDETRRPSNVVSKSLTTNPRYPYEFEMAVDVSQKGTARKPNEVAVTPPKETEAETEKPPESQPESQPETTPEEKTEEKLDDSNTAAPGVAANTN